MESIEPSKFVSYKAKISGEFYLRKEIRKEIRTKTSIIGKVKF